MTGHASSGESPAPALAAALPSWRSGPARDALLAFLWDVTEGPTPVPHEDRIATFDNDGTLTCEKPHTALAAFLEEENRRAGGGRMAAGDGHKVLREVARLFDGTTVEAYEQRVRSFLGGAMHPRFSRPYPALVYQPMYELLELLRHLHFSVFVCSDSSRDFVRVLAGPAYALSRERVIGSEVRIELRNGELTRTADPVPLDDGPGKVVHIWDRTGRPPLLAAGNAAGDIDMLNAARMALLIHHDDPDREYAYVDDQALAAAAKRAWTVISMRHDFEPIWKPGDDVRS